MSIRDFKLPDLGEGLEEGDVVAWHVEVGDVIELNQTVAEIETAKAVVEVPSPFAGEVVERIGAVGETLEVGAVFLRIDTASTNGGAAVPPSAADDPDVEDLEVTVAVGPAEDLEERRPSTGLDAETEPQPLVGYGQREGGSRRRRRGGEAPADATDAGGEASTRVLAKPPVRKLAKDLGVDLAALAPGSGPDGVITRDDVRAASTASATDAAPAAAVPVTAASPPPASDGSSAAVAGYRGRTPGDIEPVAGIRKRIVEKMETSRRSIPEATCSRWADVTDLWELRRDLTAAAAEDGHEVKITPFAIVLRAVVVALRRFPTLNASMVGRDGSNAGEIHLHEAIHLGFAADTDRGLVVPVIRDAHRLTRSRSHRASTASRPRRGTASSRRPSCRVARSPCRTTARSVTTTATP